MSSKKLGGISKTKEAELLTRITELEETIKLLNVRESQTSEIIEDMIDIKCRTDMNGIISYISSTKHAPFKYEHRCMLGRNICDLVHTDYIDLFKDNLNRLITGDTFIKSIIKFNHIYGGDINIEVTAQKVQYHVGMEAELNFYLKKVTDSFGVEEELKKSEERYRKLVELFPESIVISVDGKIEYCNQASAGLVNVDSKKYIIGRNVLDFVCPEYVNQIKDRISEISMKGLYNLLHEWELLRLDGNRLYVESMSMAVPYYKKTAILSVIHDITERKLSNELRAKIDENKRLLIEAIEYDNLKTDLFSNISHELRTPLNVILGVLQTFKLMFTGNTMEYDIDRVQRYTNIMKQNCYRLLRLVNNLIDITRIDAGFFNIKLRNCNIISIVEEIALSVAEYANQKGIKLVFDTDIEEKYTACDPDKIERIILNLLSNAIKFTKPGGDIIVYMEDKNDKINIHIKDNGIGIPQEKLADVFERFRQVDKSFVRYHQGSGIGLSLVKSLVKLHCGNISVESTVGVGSKFTIELPITAIEKQEDEYCEISANHSRIEMINIEFSDIYST